MILGLFFFFIYVFSNFFLFKIKRNINYNLLTPILFSIVIGKSRAPNSLSPPKFLGIHICIGVLILWCFDTLVYTYALVF